MSNKFFIIPLVIFSFLSSKSVADNEGMWIGDKRFMQCSQLIKYLNEKDLLEHFNITICNFRRGFISEMNVPNDKYLKAGPDWDGIIEVIKRCKEEPMSTSIEEIYWDYKNKTK